ncbi:hypothetical protein like AT1G22170 [Hibiscus trionum]|uniref:Phosphoglycerate mutase n=1 Tax=Hibiscus trionum TaxID=183268 RepID=A0A9W7IAL9_HIBTR|nr:hypothetical protein like AT1G22170 [Hibiscus trionum]
MATVMLHQTVVTRQLLSHCQVGNNSVNLLPKDLKVEVGFSKRGANGFGEKKSSVIQASASQTSVCDPVLSPSNKNTHESIKKSSEAALILIRHGESLWNEKNLFTGCVDVPLTKKAIEAGKRISNIPVDMIFACADDCYASHDTALSQEGAYYHALWNQIHSEDTIKQSIPVIADWQLNERMYGELQGLSKQETADRFGKEKVHEWRRSYDIPPLNGESLEMCARRAVSYFKDEIEPQLISGKNVMIAAHGNSLRSIIMYLDKLTSQERLAQYRQKLDEMRICSFAFALPFSSAITLVI